MDIFIQIVDFLLVQITTVVHVELLKGVWHGINWVNSGELFLPKAHLKY